MQRQSSQRDKEYQGKNGHRAWGARSGVVAALIATTAGYVVPVATVPAYAAVSHAPSPAAEVSALLTPFVQNGAFSGSVIVAQRGKVLVDQGYGLANQFQGVKNTPQTRFAIGGLTQGFVAVAVMQLVSEGKIKLDNPVSDYTLSQTAGSNEITIRELLTQTSGAPTTPTAAPTQPGTAYGYSPLNYQLLAGIISAVTGESAQTYIENYILTPLGLTNTGFIQTDTGAVQGSATGYDFSNGIVSAVNYSPGKFANAMGMYSTTEDLYKWDQALYTGKIIPLSDIRQVFTVDPIALASMGGSVGYGFGWTLTADNAVAVEESQDPGFMSFIDRDLQSDTTVIVLANNDYGPLAQIAGQLESIVTNEQLPPAMTPLVKVGGLKHIVVNGRHLPNAYSRVARGTVYMPLSSISTVFGHVKVRQTWYGSRRILWLTTGRQLSGPLDSQSLGSGNTDVFLNGQLVMRINTYTWQVPSTKRHSMIPYASISDITLILQSLGLKTSWHGATWSIRG